MTRHFSTISIDSSSIKQSTESRAIDDVARGRSGCWGRIKARRSFWTQKSSRSMLLMSKRLGVGEFEKGGAKKNSTDFVCWLVM